MRNFFVSISLIVSVKVCIFPLNLRDIIIYVARWWEKYLSKLIPLKHSCWWRDKLIVLWILNREAKIFLRTRAFFKDCVLACKVGNQMHTRFKETKVTPAANGSFAPKWLFCKTWFLYNIYFIIWSKNFSKKPLKKFILSKIGDWGPTLVKMVSFICFSQGKFPLTWKFYQTTVFMIFALHLIFQIFFRTPVSSCWKNNQ